MLVCTKWTNCSRRTNSSRQTNCLFPYHYLSTIFYHFPLQMRLQLILLAALQFSDSKYMLTFILRPWEGVEKIGRTSSLYRVNKQFVRRTNCLFAHVNWSIKNIPIHSNFFISHPIETKQFFLTLLWHKESMHVFKSKIGWKLKKLECLDRHTQIEKFIYRWQLSFSPKIG